VAGGAIGGSVSLAGGDGVALAGRLFGLDLRRWAGHED
jgi:hypothetical protein